MVMSRWKMSGVDVQKRAGQKEGCDGFSAYHESFKTIAHQCRTASHNVRFRSVL